MEYVFDFLHEDNPDMPNDLRQLLLVRRLKNPQVSTKEKFGILDKLELLSENRVNIDAEEKVSRKRYPTTRLSTESVYYVDYVLDESNRYRHCKEGSTDDCRFKHRARMSKSFFDCFVQIADNEIWFPRYVLTNDFRGRRKPPLGLMILSALSVLGGSMSFGSLVDVTNVSETSHRMFFDEFVEVGAKKMFPKWVNMSFEEEELQTMGKPYAMAGLPGAICSVDGVRFRMWSCSYSLKNQNVGKEGYPTRTVQIAVSYSGKILSCSRSFDGNQPDVNIAGEDLLFHEFRTNPKLKNFEYNVLDAGGNDIPVKGAWAIVDNGYPDLPFLQFPSKNHSTEKDAHFSRMLESIRKDVERAFGILKQRFRMLKFGFTVQRLPVMENIIHTCCSLHNFIVERSGRELAALSLNCNEFLENRIYARRIVPFEPGPIAKRQRSLKHSQPLRSLLLEHFEYTRTRGQLFWPKLVKPAMSNPYNDDLLPGED